MPGEAFDIHSTVKSVPLSGQHTLDFTVTSRLLHQVQVDCYVEITREDQLLGDAGWIYVVEPSMFNLAPGKGRQRRR